MRPVRTTHHVVPVIDSGMLDKKIVLFVIIITFVNFITIGWRCIAHVLTPIDNCRKFVSIGKFMDKLSIQVVIIHL